ncbi:MAG TPA: type I glyceraldehyde-3-phosphate dehydrogenase [Candidatus Polarisedimenticolia bacterium]|nr:type I glyceraldehyde-3-phosphate dehydrogenase [Candidatus Polarisedimenticolia bacterium]
MRIGINGLGRIGRTLFRLAWAAEDIQVAGVNDVAPPETLAYLLSNDSIAGRWKVPVEGRESSIVAEGRVIPCTRHASPEAIPWGDWGVEIVVEATGLFRERAAAARHLRGGARQVIISAPSPDADRTVVWGINQAEMDPSRHPVVSGASCTTQCAAPLIRIADEAWGVEACSMTTIHCYTNDQPLMDAPHHDRRRSRAAGMSMIPTSTSASQALEGVFPDLASKITCLAVRVPIPFVSAVDLVTSLKRETDLETVREVFRTAEQGPWGGIVGYTEEEWVSVDFRGDSRSAVVDGKLLALPSPRLLKVFAWYDNESGYSHRLVDLIRHLARIGGAP